MHGVILAGIEGSGKTAMGRQVAGKLGWRCLDADDVAPLLSGMSLDEAHRLLAEHDDWTARQIRDHRAQVLRAIVLRRPRLPIIIPTTMRPLLDGSTTPEVAQALHKNWLIILLDRDLDQVSEYLWSHPEARIRRQRLDECSSRRDVRDALWDFKRSMAVAYAEYCQANVTLGATDDEARVLAEIIRLLTRRRA